MAALQHVKSRATVCSALRQLFLLPKQSFSFSFSLQGKIRKRESRVQTRFARIEPPIARPKKTPLSDEKKSSVQPHPEPEKAVPFNADVVNSLLQKMDNDLPLSNMPDPFMKDYPRCYLCTNDIRIDYKNVQLLSQFVSPYTGRIYGRAITGLCIPMQKHVSAMIIRSRASGYMPYIMKDPKFLQDPQPFNPMSRKRT